MKNKMKFQEVFLDRQLDIDAFKIEARRIFETEKCTITSKYSLEPVTLFAKATSFLTQTVEGQIIVGLTGNMIWEATKWAFSKFSELDSKRTDEERTKKPLMATARYEAAEIVYELHHWASQPLSDYKASVIINLVDNTLLPRDAYRISIHLNQNYIKCFDRQGLLISELPFKSN